jgi:hypothetical protein
MMWNSINHHACDSRSNAFVLIASTFISAAGSRLPSASSVALVVDCAGSTPMRERGKVTSSVLALMLAKMGLLELPASDEVSACVGNWQGPEKTY